MHHLSKPIAAALSLMALVACSPSVGGGHPGPSSRQPQAPARTISEQEAITKALAAAHLTDAPGFPSSNASASCTWTGGGPAPGKRYAANCSTTAVQNSDGSWQVTLGTRWILSISASSVRNHEWVVSVDPTGRVISSTDSGDPLPTSYD